MKASRKYLLTVIALVVAGTLAPPLLSANQSNAENTYKAKCASCHAADGSGDTAFRKALKVRDLRDPEVQKQTDEQLYDIIAKGKNKMPGYEKTLKADEIKGLVAHIRGLAKKS